MDGSDENKPRPAHWFKKGQSGNPSGRRKSPDTLATDVVEVFGGRSPVQIGERLENLPTMEQVFLAICLSAVKGSNKHLKIAVETMLALRPPPGKMSIEEKHASYRSAAKELAQKLRIPDFPEPPSRLPKEIRDAIRDRKQRAKIELARRKKERGLSE